MALYNPSYNSYLNQYGLQPQLFNPMITQNQLQIQNGGLVSIPCEEEARKYPVAPGNSVTFKDENAPYVYTKTMGFSQLDRPLFDKFRLVKEDDTPASADVEQSDIDGKLDNIKYLVQEDLAPLVKDIKHLETKINDIDSVLEELQSSCSASVKQVTESVKTASKTTAKGGK